MGSVLNKEYLFFSVPQGQAEWAQGLQGSIHSQVPTWLGGAPEWAPHLFTLVLALLCY